MPIPEFPESINTEYLIMGVTSRLSIERHTLMERAEKVIIDHAPEEITKASALIMAAVDIAFDRGYGFGVEMIDTRVRSALQSAATFTAVVIDEATPPPVKVERRRPLLEDLPTPPAVMMGGFRAALRRPSNR